MSPPLRNSDSAPVTPSSSWNPLTGRMPRMENGRECSVLPTPSIVSPAVTRSPPLPPRGASSWRDELLSYTAIVPFGDPPSCIPSESSLTLSFAPNGNPKSLAPAASWRKEELLFLEACFDDLDIGRTEPYALKAPNKSFGPVCFCLPEKQKLHQHTILMSRNFQRSSHLR